MEALKNRRDLRKLCNFLEKELPSLLEENLPYLLGFNLDFPTPESKNDFLRKVSSYIVERLKPYLKPENINRFLTQTSFSTSSEEEEKSIEYLAKPIGRLVSAWLQYNQYLRQKRERVTQPTPERRIISYTERKTYTYSLDKPVRIEKAEVRERALEESRKERKAVKIEKVPVEFRRDLPPRELAAEGLMLTLAQIMLSKNAFDAREKYNKLLTRDDLKNFEQLGAWADSYKLISELFDSELDGKSILDLGCGAKSPLALSLKDKGINASLIGVDFHQASVEAAKENFPAYDFILGFFPYSLPLKEKSFDYVFAVNSMHYSTNSEKYATLLLLHGLLKEGGKLVVIQDYNQRSHFHEVRKLVEKVGYTLERNEQIVISWPPTDSHPRGVKSRSLLLVAKKERELNLEKELQKALVMSYLEAGKLEEVWKLIPQDELEKARELPRKGIREAYHPKQSQVSLPKQAKHVCGHAKKVESDLYHCPKYDVKLRSGALLCLTCENPHEKFDWEAKPLFREYRE